MTILEEEELLERVVMLQTNYKRNDDPIYREHANYNTTTTTKDGPEHRVHANFM